jgi:hypothetical protein
MGWNIFIFQNRIIGIGGKIFFKESVFPVDEFFFHTPLVAYLRGRV